jgi:hypothetical protein
MLEQISVRVTNTTEAAGGSVKSAAQRNSRMRRSALGSLDLRLNGVGFRDRLERIGVHTQHCEKCLAAVVSEENAKGESGKYSTGEA